MPVKTQHLCLPYIDNAKAIVITLGINLGVVFLFHWPQGITFAGVMWDSLCCVLITIIIDMGIVYTSLKKMRARGAMPSPVPLSRLMQKLPQNPFALGGIYLVVFGALTLGINALILRFFQQAQMHFVPWMVYKLVYATVLSIKIVEYCIFRYVQPDWAEARIGGVKVRDGTMPQSSPAQSVKDPLPRIAVFKEMFASITGNMALNMLFGSVLGSVALQADGSLVIAPTPVEAIPLSGLIFGLLTGLFVTHGVVKEIKAAIRASRPLIPETALADKRFSWMPVGTVPLTFFVCAVTMLFSAAALWFLMKLFNMAVMNFYQFTLFITVYACILCKPLSSVLTRRCLQPDYIRATLNGPCLVLRAAL